MRGEEPREVLAFLLWGTECMLCSRGCHIPRSVEIGEQTDHGFTFNSQSAPGGVHHYSMKADSGSRFLQASARF